ncbi:MAG: hypothetical protein JWN17_82 [Frankiales bacterium]|nr:hypothetical protein [Frankiales bacterium]
MAHLVLLYVVLTASLLGLLGVVVLLQSAARALVALPGRRTGAHLAESAPGRPRTA